MSFVILRHLKPANACQLFVMWTSMPCDDHIYCVAEVVSATAQLTAQYITNISLHLLQKQLKSHISVFDCLQTSSITAAEQTAQQKYAL